MIWGFSLDQLLALVTTLVVIIDPLGNAPVFAGLTVGGDDRYRLRMAIKAHVIAACVLTLFALTGNALLAFLGIGLPAFRTAGGLMLLMIALEMVFEKRSQRKSKAAEKQMSALDKEEPNEALHDIAVFPVAIPLLAGPGSVATVLLLASGGIGQTSEGMALLIGVILAIMLLSCLAFILVGKATRWLNDSVLSVVTRLLGILLAALAMQYILDGLKASLFS
ncbi:MarC family protein [Rhodovibrionaceae bacterium A322]